MGTHPIFESDFDCLTDRSKMYVQFEHASGYVLVHCENTDDINQLDINDWATFSQAAKLVAFKPFTSAANALDNMNAVSEGLVHEDMKAFLSSNLPEGQTVGILDPKLLQTVKEEVGCKGSGGEIVQEICRGIRVHMSHFVKALEPAKEKMAQLGLGHSYSRSKVKFNVNRSDNMVIQAIALIDQLDKDINTFAMRVREWYGYHFPELVKLVNDNYQYCQLVKLIKNRKCLTELKRLLWTVPRVRLFVTVPELQWVWTFLILILSISRFSPTRLLVWQIIVRSFKVIFLIKWELSHHHLHHLSAMLSVLD